MQHAHKIFGLLLILYLLCFSFASRRQTRKVPHPECGAKFYATQKIKTEILSHRSVIVWWRIWRRVPTKTITFLEDDSSWDVWIPFPKHPIDALSYGSEQLQDVKVVPLPKHASIPIRCDDAALADTCIVPSTFYRIVITIMRIVIGGREVTEEGGGPIISRDIPGPSEALISRFAIIRTTTGLRNFDNRQALSNRI